MILLYDPTGNLVRDQSNGLDSITWTLRGKVAQIIKNDGHTLSFKYDPLGNRLSKSNITYGTNSKHSLNEYYIRDASGNELATYRHQQDVTYEELSGPKLTDLNITRPSWVRLRRCWGRTEGLPLR